jgi:orotidine-5'-phosphate decarboxylase
MNETSQQQKAASDSGYRRRLIVALDHSDPVEAAALVDKLADDVISYKIGMELYHSNGSGLVTRLADRGKHVFLDLKFHDIPNTVAQVSKAVTKLGVTMFNVHAAGGIDMMRRAKDASLEAAATLGKPAPLLLAVTVLTSMDQQAFENDLGFSGRIEDKVLSWACMTQKAGLDGVVASAREAAAIKRVCGESFLIVTPGIRPKDGMADDQQRIMDPATALREGADYLVVGRPITRHKNPVEAARLILREMEGI